MRNKDQILLEEAYSKVISESTCSCDCKKCENEECEKCTCEECKDHGCTCEKEEVTEESKKSVSSKTYSNPWAIKNKIEKDTGKKLTEKDVKKIKSSIKKSGKKVTSKKISKK